MSIKDVVVIALGIAVSAVFAFRDWRISFVVGCVVGHFFLFCNVFRVSRIPELIWAAVFLSTASGTLLAGVPGWRATMAVSVCVTVLLLVLEMRKVSYHGIGWRRINPGLREWWEAQSE